MKNKILYTLLGIMVVLNIGLIIFVGVNHDCNCECDYVEKTEEEEIKDKYKELNNKLIEYLNDVYNTSEYEVDNVETNIHTITLRELKDKGYDISMFVNPSNGRECNLDKSYGKFIILGTREDGTLDYTYNTNLYCED